MKNRALKQSWSVGISLRIASVLVMLAAVYQIFNIGYYTGFSMFNVQYIYLILAFTFPVIFIALSIKTGPRKGSVPWYDWLLSCVSFLTCGFFLLNTENALNMGWEFSAPSYVVYMSYLMWAITLEACRRCGGWPIFFVVLLMSAFPLLAGLLPSSMAATSTPISYAAIYHVLSAESILGIPAQAFGQIVVGFLIFGVALQCTGGGQFFINLSFSLLGKVRGGPAKVAILSSGLMGSMSGTVVTNVLTTGPLSIPAMRKVGFSKTFAASVETCASTGGVLMPPVMGAVAFIMAVFLEMPYSDIAIAAVIPCALYFYGLFVQIDLYAAKNGLKGLPEVEIPSFKETMKSGWHYIFVLVLLVYLLLHMQQEAIAPFYTTVLLIVLNQVKSSHRWNWKDFGTFIETVGKQFVELMGLIAGIGMVMGGISVTGMSGTIANDLLFIAGDSPVVLLVMGAITSLILGVGMPITAAYIFLAVSLAPALTEAGFDPLAVHMFILYWGMLSYITPPVAMGAFTAAKVAGSNPMATAVTSMKLGGVIYFIPFFFVMDSALLMQGEVGHILKTVLSAAVGIFFCIAAMQSYLPKVGRLSELGILHWPIRAVLLFGGFFLAMPINASVGIPSNIAMVASIGAIAVAVGVGVIYSTMCRRSLRRY